MKSCVMLSLSVYIFSFYVANLSSCGHVILRPIEVACIRRRLQVLLTFNRVTVKCVEIAESATYRLSRRAAILT